MEGCWEAVRPASSLGRVEGMAAADRAAGGTVGRLGTGATWEGGLDCCHLQHNGQGEMQHRLMFVRAWLH